MEVLNCFYLILVGVVGQEPVLFRGTIADNISIACPEATREEIQRVAEMAYAHDFIINLPNVSAKRTKSFINCIVRLSDSNVFRLRAFAAI